MQRHTDSLTFSRVLFALLLIGSISLFSYVQFANAFSGQDSAATIIRNDTNTASPISDLSNGTALNWAGYVATGGTYTSVSGAWIVPKVANPSVNTADATWIGIGGTQSHDLIQAGTEAIPTASGSIVYQAWYEILPQNSISVPLSISPGDSVAVSITQQSAGEWLISFHNTTTGDSYEKTIAYDSSLSSAEWIEEMPVEIGGVLGLDDFGTVNFLSGYAIKNGQSVNIAQSGAQPLTMDNAQGQATATPSALGTDGASFSVSRSDATATPLAITRGGVRAVTVTMPSQTSYTVSYVSGARLHHGRTGVYRIMVRF